MLSGLLVCFLVVGIPVAAKKGFSLKLLFPVDAWRKVLADRASAG